jgi:hypothetical protein
VAQVIGSVAHLMAVSKRDPAEPIAHRYDHDRPFAFGQRYAGETDDLLSGHCIANDGERLLADFIRWRDLIRRVVVASVQLVARDEPLYLDCSGIPDRDGFWVRLN